MTPEVAALIETWPEAALDRFIEIRRIILDAADTPPDESLKWGQPAWRAARGTTLRCNWSADRAQVITLYVICTSDMAARVKELYPDAFTFEGSRGFAMPLSAPLPRTAISHLARMAHRYHAGR